MKKTYYIAPDILVVEYDRELLAATSTFQENDHNAKDVELSPDPYDGKFNSRGRRGVYDDWDDSENEKY